MSNNFGSESTGTDFLVRVVDRVGTTDLFTRVVSVPELGAHSGRSATVHMTLLSHCGETHRLVVTVDSTGAIDESNETDNTTSQYYTLHAS